MLRSLHLKDVGPAARFDMEFGERLNVLTGDNGLGKSFVLDVTFWALTGSWAERPILPRKGCEEIASLDATVMRGDDVEKLEFEGRFERVSQSWENKNHTTRGVRIRPATEVAIDIPDWAWRRSPVLYIRADMELLVWDPGRNHRSDSSYDPSSVTPIPYRLSPQELWNGLVQDGKPLCNGLIRDWATWQLEADEEGARPFQLLSRVLEDLSHPLERMTPGKPVRLYLDDVRKFPTIELPYGTIPVIHASAGMRRIISLAYLLAWAWTEHVEASSLLGWTPAERLVVLLEEPETHLHPRWQRHVLPALLKVLTGLSSGMRPQLLVTTHSPMVLASLEPYFSESEDKLFLFELENRQVNLREVPWTKYGDVIGWLTSPIFGLEQARSIEAERAIEAAEALMRGELEALPEGLRTEDEIHRALQRYLPAQDRFWPRWIVRRERGAA